jgi:hypothetical protein
MPNKLTGDASGGGTAYRSGPHEFMGWKESGKSSLTRDGKSMVSRRFLG